MKLADIDTFINKTNVSNVAEINYLQIIDDCLLITYSDNTNALNADKVSIATLLADPEFTKTLFSKSPMTFRYLLNNQINPKEFIALKEAYILLAKIFSLPIDYTLSIRINPVRHATAKNTIGYEIAVADIYTFNSIDFIEHIDWILLAAKTRQIEIIANEKTQNQLKRLFLVDIKNKILLNGLNKAAKHSFWPNGTPEGIKLLLGLINKNLNSKTVSNDIFDEMADICANRLNKKMSQRDKNVENFYRAIASNYKDLFPQQSATEKLNQPRTHHN